MKSRTLALILVLCLLVPLTVAQAGMPDEPDGLNPDGLSWQVQEPYGTAKLTILGPDGLLIEQDYATGETLFWSAAGAGYPDGEYSYELVLQPVAQDAAPAELGRDGQAAPVEAQEPRSVYGAFGIYNDKLVPVGDEVGMMDIVHLDDVIIQFSLCVGTDCDNGENFGFDTLRLKENNLRIHFQDTSSSASFPTRDWRIIINDSANGGADYFAVQDADTSRNVFLVEGGAPAYSLYVDDYGDVGLGTSTPVVELHIKDSDTPTMRLQQDSSGGWSPQTWDVGGNEANFFIRDASNGGTLPFRIQPNTPSSALCLKSNGRIGIGTWSPSFPLHVWRSGEDATMAVTRGSGATGYMSAGSDKVSIGSTGNYTVGVMVNNNQVAQFATDGKFSVGQSPNDATMYGNSSAGYFGTQDGQYIKFFVGDTVVARLDGSGNLAISGSFIEGVPLSAADSDAPDKDASEIEELKAEVAAQSEQIADLEARLAALEAAVAAQLAPADTRLK